MFDQDTLNEVIRRIVEIAEPERIILFGSAARGDMTRHSDLDPLINKEGGDALDLMGQIYERLYGVGATVDDAGDRARIAGRISKVRQRAWSRWGAKSRSLIGVSSAIWIVRPHISGS